MSTLRKKSHNHHGSERLTLGDLLALMLDNYTIKEVIDMFKEMTRFEIYDFLLNSDDQDELIAEDVDTGQVYKLKSLEFNEWKGFGMHRIWLKELQVTHPATCSNTGVAWDKCDCPRQTQPELS